MRVSLTDFTSAINKVKSFANTVNEAPGILLDFCEDKVRVCYSDGRKAIIEEVNAEREEGDITGKIVMSYNRLTYIVDMCQASGSLKVDEMSFAFDIDSKSFQIEAKKYMVVQGRTGDVDAEGNEVYEEKRNIVSKVCQKANFEYVEDSMRYGVLSRMNYAGIFEAAADDFDTWDKAELRSLLTKISTEKGRVSYISGVQNKGFAVNFSYTVTVPCDCCQKHGFTVDYTLAKAVIEILGQIKTDKVRIHNQDKRYVNIVDDTDTVGIWFEMAPVSRTDNTTLTNFTAKDYEDYKLIFTKAALVDVIKNVMSSSKDDKTTLTFGLNEDGDRVLKINVKNTGASVAGDFEVRIEGREVKNWESLVELKIPISLKMLMDTLGHCEEHYVAMDMEIADNGKFMRIGDVIGRDENGEALLSTCHYAIVDR